jgi:hypothetical protein
MGFSAAEAAAFAGHWLSLSHTAPGFATVAAAVRLASAVDQVKLPAPIHAGAAKKVDGLATNALVSTQTKNNVKLVQTLYVRAAGAPLPVEESVVRNGTLVSRVVFTRWNEHVTAAVPAGAVPLG